MCANFESLHVLGLVKSTWPIAMGILSDWGGVNSQNWYTCYHIKHTLVMKIIILTGKRWRKIISELYIMFIILWGYLREVVRNVITSAY